MTTTELLSLASVLIALASMAYAVASGRANRADKIIDEVEARMGARVTEMEKRTAARITSVEARVTAVDAKSTMTHDRVIAIETEIEHLPDKDATHRLEINLAGVQAELKGLADSVKPLADMAHQIQSAMVDKIISS